MYTVHGQLFFASVQDFTAKIDEVEKVEQIIIGFSDAHIWDDSSVGAVDRVYVKLKEKSQRIEFIGLNESSKRLVERLAVYPIKGND
ncbi:STAS domain-containing protein [Chungangia koreensis]|uniref:STAS domain-containing protein n=1 Tax=Chungangia koreensis TaxID=752657 RepID=A0ABV8X5T3_9LACT